MFEVAHEAESQKGYRSQTYASCSDDLTLGSEELEEVKSLRILGVSFDSKLTFETHLCEVVSKAARSLAVVRWAGNLFDCSRVVKSPTFIIVTPCGCRLRSLI